MFVNPRLIHFVLIGKKRDNLLLKWDPTKSRCGTQKTVHFAMDISFQPELIPIFEGIYRCQS